GTATVEVERLVEKEHPCTGDPTIDVVEKIFVPLMTAPEADAMPLHEGAAHQRFKGPVADYFRRITLDKMNEIEWLKIRALGCQQAPLRGIRGSCNDVLNWTPLLGPRELGFKV